MARNQRIAYISDVGAFGLKPLFITGAVITTVFLDLAFVSERWLRHFGRLAPNTSRVQSALSAISIFFAIAGTCGLILLSIFDTYHHSRVHNGCLFIFLAGYIISAIFLCAEYQRLGIHYRQHRVLRLSFWIKLAFIFVEVALAIVFAVTSWRDQEDVAAIFEWIVALIFTFYVLSFLLDLWPSVRSRHHVPQGWQEREAQLEKEAQRNGGLPPLDQGPAPITSEPNQGTYQNQEGELYYDRVTGQYRGTNMTAGQGAHHQAANSTHRPDHSDLGRQKKSGIGRTRF
ncbi:hypothetical protein A1O7_01479 [Cladophialophora yegresii CBS 114405]|uniref:CWH43-like N-terminal domain-containing protein n=1 Tax=Cladophialophora yegresii CBS 114405 TaxID=1182544 RepID=W9X3S2_9EURO|nr:uncharacterized protein A1O7_01479 [Cladophialophora yegresii CBS 114405]EXJ65139.1 hypothetical protein A1O7_01479 [Cladophialophora yegresii CBS 114405]